MFSALGVDRSGIDAEKLLELQSALIAEYSAPSFQQKLWDAFAEAGDDFDKQDEAKGSLTAGIHKMALDRFSLTSMDEVAKAMSEQRSDPWVCWRRRRMELLLNPRDQCEGPAFSHLDSSPSAPSSPPRAAAGERVARAGGLPSPEKVAAAVPTLKYVVVNGGWWIDAVTFLFDGRPNVEFVASRGGKLHTFVLGKDEHLTRVQGWMKTMTKGQEVWSIQFVTSSGRLSEHYGGGECGGGDVEAEAFRSKGYIWYEHSAPSGEEILWVDFYTVVGDTRLGINKLVTRPRRALEATSAAELQGRAPQPLRLWRVVGSANKDGILVRLGEKLTSEPRQERLAFGAEVEEVARKGDRLMYRLRTGKGPEAGWVSVVSKGAAMLEPVEKELY